jgi:lysozyme
MNISAEGLGLIKKFEGCVLDAYKCPAGVWTIGYGHTKDVQPGDSWSQSHAEHMLEVELEEYESYIKDLVKVNLSQNQFDALVSWVYNLGPANLKASTLLKVLNAGEYDEVPAQIKRWNKAGGQVLDGLIRRREAESLLFCGEDWTNV